MAMNLSVKSAIGFASLKSCRLSTLFLALWLASIFVPHAWAGGGPENVLLLGNSNSDDSRTIANHYINIRKIPPNNVLYIDWKGSLSAAQGDNFRDKIILPTLKA